MSEDEVAEAYKRLNVAVDKVNAVLEQFSKELSKAMNNVSAAIAEFNKEEN